MNVVELRDGRLAQVAQQLADADAVPKFQIAYPRNGVWSGNNQLGFEIPFDPSAQTAQTVLKMDEWGMPGIWTVSLGVTLKRELVDGEFFDCIAEIDFGSGGIMQHVDIDWVDGAQFALPMNAIDVKARWNDTAAALGLGAPDGVRISVLLSQMSPARSRATRSRFFILIHEVESISTSSGIPHDRIPLFSKSAQVLPINPADGPLLYGANFELQFFANSQTLNPILTIPGNFLAPGVKVPIPQFARYYGMTINGTSSVSGFVLFNLFDE